MSEGFRVLSESPAITVLLQVDLGWHLLIILYSKTANEKKLN